MIATQVSVIKVNVTIAKIESKVPRTNYLS
jgi:hypothetical protein